MVLTDETSPACVVGAFETAVGAVLATDTITERFRSGDGFARVGCARPHVLDGCERFFRPGYLNFLTSWIGALDGAEAKLHAGRALADLGCGHGASTLILTEAYPESTVVGFDAHDGSIADRAKRAAEAGLTDRLSFEEATAKSFAGPSISCASSTACTTWVIPLAPAGTSVTSSRPGGSVLLVEPFANDDLSGNLNPVGAVYYGFSTLLCTPSSLSQEVGAALGAQAGEGRLRELLAEAGFGSFRRVAETPFNLVFEARV